MRTINDRFIQDLKEGELSFFLTQVKTNQELCLEVRNGYINIYYRGGNLLKITQKSKNYTFDFDTNYCLNKHNDTNYPLLKSLSKNNTKDYIDHFFLMLKEMDEWFLYHPKAEREFQHNLINANKNIIDIEYQVRNKSRLDMIIYKDNKLMIVENKYGTGAISGQAGLSKHYQDISRIISNEDTYNELCQSMIHISQIKYKLGLRDYFITSEDIKHIEILFLFANYNLKSKSIFNELLLIDKKIPVKFLFMNKTDSIIDYNQIKDISEYEH